MKILVTGANGFVGRPLCRTLTQAGLSVRAALRRSVPLPEADEAVVVGEIGPETRWSTALANVDAIIHLAARVHVMRDAATEPRLAFRRVNVLGSERLARCAAQAGVRRLIFVSSIKVMGEYTPAGDAFSEDKEPQPIDPYGLSKWAAEQALLRIAEQTGIELTIVRPPLVYGPGVRANFLSLMKLVALGLPLPLGGIGNRRSLIYVNNLTNALLRCTIDPRAVGRTFLVADEECLSTTQLVRELAGALDARARLLSLPPAVLRLLGRIARQSAAIARLTDSLAVDTGKIQEVLDWKPPYTLRQGLAETAKWFPNRIPDP